jgi:enamine deaminase RidA (YjgF/YER057c/UK114 family)
MNILQPAGWTPPTGYANGVAARGTLVFVAGQVGWNAAQRLDSDDFVEQATQALRNVVAVLAEAGARPEHIARMTWYVVDKREYLGSLRALGEAYRAVIGPHYPAMTAIEVRGLVEEGARVEIEATAVIPDAADVGRAAADGG